MRPELRLMIEKAASKLKTARIDFENGQYDDSISRSYYAVFHALSAALLQKGLTYSSHSQADRILHTIRLYLEKDTQ